MIVNYIAAFENALILPTKLTCVALRVQEILNYRERYEAVTLETNVPWFVIAAIHNLEAGLNFTENLANGDPLTARTTHVPVGRPIKGTPPFTWEDTAIDVLNDGYPSHPTSWGIGNCLAFMEEYNGLGYRNIDVMTPYLWSFTTLYSGGMYVADGNYDPKAISQEIGAAALLKSMVNSEIIQLEQ